MNAMTTDLDTRLFGPLEPRDPAAIDRLHAALVAAADPAGLLDIAYRTVDSPIGPLLLVATERGLLRVAFASEGHAAVLEGLAGQVSPRILNAPRRLDPVARELDEYFEGHRTTFDLPLDRRLSKGFRLAVLERLPEIPYGSTASYAAVARRVGNPRAMRAVGSACATNPLPLVVPCHRVVRSDGSMGGYGGGLEAKRALLALEAAHA
jgi:methylated-DNA-[protein]-cysteine S-methyltransferase